MVQDKSHSAMGLVLPSTSHPEGRTIARSRDQFTSVSAGDTVQFDLQAGLVGHSSLVAAARARAEAVRDGKE